MLIYHKESREVSSDLYVGASCTKSKEAYKMQNYTEQIPETYHTQKSRIFEMIFSDKRELLELYNAVNGTSYEKPELLEINTLKNAIYMSMHNDISFIVDSRLTLYEHQSTYSPNLPLRYLMYVADLYSRMTKDENLYGSRIVKLPTPRFLVFYNGTTKLPDMVELKLSDAFQVKEEQYSLELCATLLNINPGHNQKLLGTCKTLRDYALYTDRVRTYAKTMSLGIAVEKAIEECIRDNVLAEFLRNNRSEAISVSIYEYDEERTMRQLREEAFEDGVIAGIEKEKVAGICTLIEILMEEGISPERIVEKLKAKFQLSHEEALNYLNSTAKK